MTRAHFKYLAKRQLEGKVGTLFLAAFLFSLVILASMIVVATIGAALVYIDEEIGTIISIVLLALEFIFLFVFAVPAYSIGYIMMLQRIVANPGEKPRSREIFRGFKRSWGAFKVIFFSSVFVYLWSMLFVIPGIIKVYSYSQAMFILAENPDIGALEAIRRSKIIMKGRKFDLFVLELSFYPWFLLMPFTLDLLGIWLFPYMSLTFINFYEHAKSIPGSPDYGFPTYSKVVPAQDYMPNYFTLNTQTDSSIGTPGIPNKAMPVTPGVDSVPTENTAPVAEAAPVTEKAPVAEAAPVTEKAPVAESAPVAEEASAVEETPATEEAPVAAEAPAVDDASVVKEAPAVEDAPKAE